VNRDHWNEWSNRVHTKAGVGKHLVCKLGGKDHCIELIHYFYVSASV
jgi:hypothetical protein